MCQVSRLELLPQLTTLNEEHEVEEDALAHVTSDGASLLTRVFPNQD